MTSIRQSFCIQLEEEFGKGNPTNEWIAVPPGSFFQSSAKRDVTRINTMGKKYADAFAYGQFKGSWSWDFVLDYNYLEPLLLIYDSYEYTDDGVHQFRMSASERPPSFCVRRVILHGVAGNTDTYPDEIDILKGCVATTLRFSQTSGNSMMQVQMSGFYVNEEMHRVSLESTDTDPYNNEDGLAEYFCLFLDDLHDEYYVANTESLGVDIQNSAAPLSNTCCPFSQGWYQAYSTFQVSTSCYANDPKRYKERFYRGGRSSGDKVATSVPTEEGEGWTQYQSGAYNSQFYERGRITDKSYKDASSYKHDVLDTNASYEAASYSNGAYVHGTEYKGYMLKPGCKNLRPLDDMWMISYNLCKDGYDSSGNQYTGVTAAIDASDRYVKFHVKKCTIASATWQKGDGSKLYDQLSSAECQLVELDIKNSSSDQGRLTRTGSNSETLFSKYHAATLAEGEHVVASTEGST